MKKSRKTSKDCQQKQFEKRECEIGTYRVIGHPVYTPDESQHELLAKLKIKLDRLVKKQNM